MTYSFFQDVRFILKNARLSTVASVSCPNYLEGWAGRNVNSRPAASLHSLVRTYLKREGKRGKSIEIWWANVCKATLAAVSALICIQFWIYYYFFLLEFLCLFFVTIWVLEHYMISITYHNIKSITYIKICMEDKTWNPLRQGLTIAGIS